MSMINSSSSELGNIRCRKCGGVFDTEGTHIDITTNRFYVPQMGENRNKINDAIRASLSVKCPYCGCKYSEERTII